MSHSEYKKRQAELDKQIQAFGPRWSEEKQALVNESWKLAKEWSKEAKQQAKAIKQQIKALRKQLEELEEDIW